MVTTPARLATASHLHDAITHAVRRKRAADHDLALLLRRCVDELLYRDLGYISITQYAEQAHSLGPSKTRALVRLADTMQHIPDLADAVRDGVIPWTKAREVARVITPTSAAEWLDHAQTVSNRELESLARHALTGDTVAQAEARRHASDDLHRFVVTGLSSDQKRLIEDALERIRQDSAIDRDDFSRGDALATVVQRFLADLDSDDASAPPSSVRFQRVVHVCDACGHTDGETGCPDDTDVLMSDCDAEVVDLMPERTRVRAPQPDREPACEHEGATVLRRPSTYAHPRTRVQDDAAPGTDRTRVRADSRPPTRGTRRKTIPPRVRTAVLHRDRHQCQVPDCTNRLYLDVHHIIPRSQGGLHTEDNLVCLCSSHHRLLHDGLLAITHAAPGRLRVQRANGHLAVVHLGSAAGRR